MERTDRVNWSTLKAMRTSPKHYLHLLATPREDTDALKQGRLTHCALYEPGALHERYVVAPSFHRGMNDDTARAKGYAGGKQAAAEWDAAMIGTQAESVTAEMMLRATSMRDAVMADPVARRFFEGGHAELQIEWTDAETGIECRGRVDHVNGALSDLKTTRSIAAFDRDAARYLYHAQLAWYHDGLLAAGIETDGLPYIIAVENEAPFDVLVLFFDAADLAAGRRVYRECLDRLAECRAANVWPGVSGGVARRIALPAWAMADTAVELDWTGAETEEEDSNG